MVKRAHCRLSPRLHTKSARNRKASGGSADFPAIRCGRENLAGAAAADTILGGKCECAAAANGPGPVDGSLLPHGAQFGLSLASPHDCIDPFFISIRVSDAAPAYSNCQPFSDGRQDRCPKIMYRQSEKLRQFMSSQPDRLSFARDIQFLIRTVVTPEELWSKATSKSASGRARDRGACGTALS